MPITLKRAIWRIAFNVLKVNLRRVHRRVVAGSHLNQPFTLDFASVGGGTFHPDAETLCFHCHEPCSVRKNLLEPYVCGDGGSETTRGACTVRHTNRSRGKPPGKAVCLGHEHDNDPHRP
ncbi:hypothetical protein SDC9_209147 [bioreactor metagenome]|uniref:Uncharacterized protein n=1 Tax=bioreactor metagenome TaxID=1076179 RepID=A0A645JE97_9ZZZZ